MVRERTQFLLRQNSGRLLLERVLAGTSLHLGRPVTAEDVGSLDVADRLWELAAAHISSARHGATPQFSAWPLDARDAVTTALAELALQLGSSGAVYLPARGWNIGPIRATPAEWLPRAFHFALGTSEEFLLCTPDASQGMFLTFDRSGCEHGNVYPYELTLWGEEWVAAAASRLPFALARSA